MNEPATFQPSYHEFKLTDEQLRDYFAAQAMQGAAAHFMRADDMEMAVAKAYQIARIMMKERSK